MFAFGSVSSDVDKDLLKNWPHVYKIHGMVYNTVNLAANPISGEKPEYGQLYYLDTEEATKCRMEIDANNKCHENLCDEINELLKEINPYYESMKMMHNVEKVFLFNLIIYIG